MHAVDAGLPLPGPEDYSGGDLQIFPTHTHDLAFQCRTLNPDDWKQIADWLGPDPHGHQKALAVLGHSPPGWVAGLGVDALHFLGLLSGSHHVGAVQHFAAAAERSANDRDYFRTMSAAVGGKSPPSKVDADFETCQLYRAVLAAAADDTDSLIQMVRNEGVDLSQRGYTTTASLCLNALTRNDQFDLAIDLVRKITKAGPCSFELRLVELSAISARVSHGSSQDPTSDLELVISNSVDLVAEVRRWGGRSSAPAEVAVSTALQFGDVETAVQLLNDPDSPERERNDPSLVRYAIDLELRDPNADLGSPVLEALNRSYHAIWNNNPDEALKEAKYAAGAADGLVDLSTAQQLLAHLGCDDIPRLDELPHHHMRTELNAKALIASGMAEDAVLLLRPIKHHQGAAQLLIKAYEESGQVDAAAAEARAAEQRFGALDFVLSESRILEGADRASDALAAISNKIATLPKTRRQRLRPRQLELLVTLGLDEEVVRALQAARTDDEVVNPAWRWTAVSIHSRQGEIDKAAGEILIHPPLEPNERNQAVSALRWLLSFGSSEAVAHAIHIAEVFSDIEDVLGTFIGHFIQNAAPGRQHLRGDLAERYGRLHESFFERFPNSNYARRQRINRDDPASVAESLAALESIAGPIDEARQHSERQAVFNLRAGALAAGAMGSLGHAYLELTLGLSLIHI